jgi:hypothetical protein
VPFPPYQACGRVSGVRRFVFALFPVVTLAAPAQAEVVLRPSAHGALHVDGGDLAGGGVGSLAAGYSLELDPILVVPEIAFTAGGYDGDFRGFGLRALGGIRGGFAYFGSFEPSLFLRGGYAHMSLDHLRQSSNPAIPPVLREVINSGALQVGASLEHRLDRDVTLGGEIVYDALFVDRVATPEGDRTISVIQTLSAGFTVAFWL